VAKQPQWLRRSGIPPPLQREHCDAPFGHRREHESQEEDTDKMTQFHNNDLSISDDCIDLLGIVCPSMVSQNERPMPNLHELNRKQLHIRRLK
jgi:hypothetical protein